MRCLALSPAVIGVRTTMFYRMLSPNRAPYTQVSILGIGRDTIPIKNPCSLWIGSQMCEVPGVLSECFPSGDDAQLGLAAHRSLEGPGTPASSIHLCPNPRSMSHSFQTLTHTHTHTHTHKHIQSLLSKETRKKAVLPSENVQGMKWKINGCHFFFKQCVMKTTFLRGRCSVSADSKAKASPSYSSGGQDQTGNDRPNY